MTLGRLRSGCGSGRGMRGPRGLAFQEADTDDHQGTLGFEEFCAFYKMMSTRRDLYLLMLTYSGHKDHLDAADLQRFLEGEQKVRAPQLEASSCCGLTLASQGGRAHQQGG